MAGLNKVILVGNLGRDPEVHYSQSGTAVCKIRLAVGESRKVKDQWEEHTEWIDVVCFGRTAENMGQHLNKGSQVCVEGRIKTDKWTDKEGNERWSTSVAANKVVFCSRGPSGGQPRAQGTPRKAEGAEEDNSYSDDLPF